MIASNICQSGRGCVKPAACVLLFANGVSGKFLVSCRKIDCGKLRPGRQVVTNSSPHERSATKIVRLLGGKAHCRALHTHGGVTTRGPAVRDEPGHFAAVYYMHQRRLLMSI